MPTIGINCPAEHYCELAADAVEVVILASDATALRFTCDSCGGRVELQATPAHLRLLALSGSPWVSADGALTAAVRDASDP